MTQRRLVQVESRTLSLSNLEKLMWPEDGITKADLIRYYLAVAPYLLPHLRDRALTVVRYPDGIGGEGFYQKNLPASAPDWLARCAVPSEGSGVISYLVANETAALVWLGNQAALELHPSHHRCDRLDRPDWAVIDLDPAERVPLDDVREVAAQAKRLLDELGIAAYPKFSGLTGIHIYLPLPRRYSYAEVSGAIGFLGRLLLQLNPRKVTIERLIRRRTGKVYVDHLQNLAGKTIAAAYSPRPHPGAPVSTPVTWDELFTRHPSEFTIRTVPDRLRRVGDLFAPVLSRPPNVTAIDRLFLAAAKSNSPAGERHLTLARIGNPGMERLAPRRDGIMKATGIVRRIDDLGRVVIPKEIRRTLRIRENDPLEIFTDREGEIIFKKYSPMGDLGDFAQEYVDALHESTGQIAVIADQDEIIAVNGAPKKALLGRRITGDLERLLESKQSQLISTPLENSPVDGYSVNAMVVSPIVRDDEVLGAVMLLAKEGTVTEVERKLCDTAANFLAKQLG